MVKFVKGAATTALDPKPKPTSGRADLNRIAKLTPPKPKADPAKLTAERLRMSKVKGEAATARQGGVKPPGTTFAPYKSLAERKPGGAPISPFQPTEDVTPPVAPKEPEPGVTATGVTGVPDTTETIKKAEEDLTPGFEQWEQDNERLFDQASDLKDEKVNSYEELYQNKLAALDKLQETMEQLTQDKNSLVASSSKIQKLEIEAAWNANQAALQIAKERLDNTQRKVIAERENQLERKKVNEENMLALIGGFGSMAGNKMLLDSIDEAQDKVAWLKTEFSLQDQEHSAKVIKLNTDYKNDKVKIEQWKQESILSNYEALEGYIEGIVGDELMADEDKVDAINAAKDQYNDTISRLHKDVIDGRFELSRQVIKRSDDLRKEMEGKAVDEGERAREAIGDAREDLALLAENYAMEDFAGLPQDVKDRFAEIEEEAGLPSGFTEQAIENFKAENKGENLLIKLERDDAGNLTVVGINKKTGVVENTTTLEGIGKINTANTLSGPEGNKLSKAIFKSGRLLNEPVTTDTVNGVEIKAKASVIKKVKAADASMKEAGLGGIDIRDSFRTNEQQRNVDPDNTNAGEGESFHEAGQAIDVNNWEEAEQYLRAEGMVNDLGPSDPGHFSIGETNKVTDKVEEKKRKVTFDE